MASDAAPVAAGMPSVNLTDAASLRLQSISFFLALFLLSAVAVRGIWNGFRSDFPRLPRLSYPKAVALVGLWGLLFVLVLTMISGARELMTPGAWKKDGVTYSLADEQKPAAPVPAFEPSESVRRDKLKSLFHSLVVYAAAHNGQYPPPNDTAIPASLWHTAHASGMPFIYLPGRTTTDPGRVLACEPELFGSERLVLFTNGDIRGMTSDELAPLLKGVK
ncbi:hypothetical protein GobsT_01910 [Gemmata obscuriglobus]|nr:hypothetical protein GobsT_01910 [Gemmata obscuriglobus]VTR98660.1 Uncharacterized protein OS=Singulisphaera acidiphila (strain ATCC BAA-1392 / DSM 18658 / VKM B-2454 / MOB10) GN=Sinac_3490 PE=4 SV=1 [Gemmata obscuriglobus UQM 2246]